MVSNELSIIQSKAAERAKIAAAVEAFTAAGGKIQVMPIVEFHPVGKHAWNRDDLVLPGSSQNTQAENREAALAQQIRELADRGAGITAIRMHLRIDNRRIQRIAEQYGITIGKVYSNQPRHLGEKARQAVSDAGRRRREKLAIKIGALAARGLTIAEMAAAAECSKPTVLRVLDEFNIERGARMAMEA
ncbi:hypothetical protein [Pseudomonas boanensis]|uniref:hypothetical protein n=1 Tax=Metapseudomonas boanensis TaxID=2822138 RepID=UPI0035D52A4D